MSIFSKITLPISLIIATAMFCAAQKQRNYIYMFDCTQSMQEKGIWDQAKNALDRTIELQRGQDGSCFTVIPFQGQAYDAFSFSGSDYHGQNGKLTTKLDELIKTRTNTNILQVFQSGMKHCNDMMDNRVYLITDGEDNINGMDKVCNAITKWCSDHKNTTFFYVTLNGMPSSPQLIETLNRCNDTYLVNVKGGAITQISDITREIYTNTLELGMPITVKLNEPGTHRVQVKCSDPYFKVESSGTFIDNAMTIKIEQRNNLPLNNLNGQLAQYVDGNGNYNFPISIQSDDQNLLIVNPDLAVKMANRRQRTLTISEGNIDEIQIKPGASWYPAFLWSSAKNQDTLKLDLNPKFNEAVTSSTEAYFSIESADGQTSDYTLLYNGKPINPDECFTVKPGSPAVLSLIFNTDAKTGKRYFEIENRGSNDLDIINGEPIGKFDELTVRTHYSIDWNPLKTFLMWLGIVIILILFLWFAFVRRSIYPKFRIKQIVIEGPGSYYLSKRTLSMRKIILTSRRRKQNIISQLFTGKILFIKADHWTPEIEITPGHRKTARVKSSDWIVTPTSTMQSGGNYKFENPKSKIKSIIKVE